MLFAALSCLQGRGQWEAARELLGYPIDGLQLTPGNKPDWPAGTQWRYEPSGVSLCYDTPTGTAWTRVNEHEGFYRNRQMSAVYGPNNELRWKNGSIHARSNWREIAWRGLTLETMYPHKQYDYGLMTTAEYEEAIEMQVPIALDLSHADICINHQLLTGLAVKRMLDHGNVRELHVSWNDGRYDSHKPFPKNYVWLEQVEAWANRYPTCPVVVECYLHKLTPPERRQQFELFARCRS